MLDYEGRNSGRVAGCVRHRPVQLLKGRLIGPQLDFGCDH